MSSLPRLAIGTVQSQADSQVMTWALMNFFRRHGRQVQHFHSRACFAPLDGATPAAGLGSRHLDSWLMSCDVSREIFARAAAKSDLAVVEGSFVPCPSSEGGSLDRLCQWLELPRVAVVDASQLGDCRIPSRPGADAILLDGVSDAAEFFRLQTILEPLWRLPVIGGLERLPHLRSAIDRLPRGGAPSEELCQELGSRFARFASVNRIQALANCRTFPDVHPQLFREGVGASYVRVAVAFDDAFHCYFADTLDLLEMRGAELVDFSPLRDESLPEGADIIYLGCGRPELFARELAQNHCMKLALHKHLCEGRRVYAEGGGLAYLCEDILTPEGRRLEMMGALPAVAVMNPRPCRATPVEMTLASGNWLGRAGSRLRGYVNSSWSLQPQDHLALYVAERGREQDLVGQRGAVGSRVHLNFAAQPDVLRSFFKPHMEVLDGHAF